MYANDLQSPALFFSKNRHLFNILKTNVGHKGVDTQESSTEKKLFSKYKEDK